MIKICSIDGRVLFTARDAETVAEAVALAVAQGTNLIRADMRDADMRGAVMRGAKMEGAELRGADLAYADLTGAVMRGADLAYADLTGADMRDAVMRYAVMRYAVMRDAVMRDADLTGADLTGAVMIDADLRDADLTRAVMIDADLRDADLRDADLRDADLRDAIMGEEQTQTLIAIANILPSVEEPVIGWKKCRGDVLVKLEVLADARRSNATGRKCRAERVRVLEVVGAPVGVSEHDPNTQYRVGEIVECHQWNSDRWAECAGGIHFWLTRSEAEAW